MLVSIRVSLPQDLASAVQEECAKSAGLTPSAWITQALERHGDKVQRTDVELAACVLGGPSKRLRADALLRQLDTWRAPFGLTRSGFVCVCCLMAARQEAQSPPRALAEHLPFVKAFLQRKIHQEIAAAAGVEVLAAEAALNRWMAGTPRLNDLTVLSKWLTVEE